MRIWVVTHVGCQRPRALLGSITAASHMRECSSHRPRLRSNFYTKVLGMEDETHLRNPELHFPGAFVRAGAQQIHIMELPHPDPVSGRPEHGGM